MNGRLEYRADIDGLRAIAVLAVLAFHLGFRPLAGGFIGVDIFFVVSGFLIGSIVFGDIETNAFSFKKFYMRRIRRLFPAMFAMLAVAAIGAYFILYPASYLDFGYSLAAAAVSVSNILFWLHSGYFDDTAATNALLHTWSLSVEEQFYLLFPPIALACARWAPKHVDKIILAIGGASFLYSAVAAFTAPSSAFYLLHSRAWELALGILLARAPAYELSRTTRNNLAAVGLAMIGASILVLKPDTPFPGLAAAPACFGTALLIAAGRGGGHFIGDLLSLKPAVYVGLISYSLYLWHWPIIVLYQYRLGVDYLEWPEKLMLMAAIFPVAMLSYHFIERPFRNAGAARQVFAAGGAILAATAAAALVIVQTRGAPSRFDPETVRIASYLDYRESEHDACFIINSADQTFDDFDRARCLTPSAEQPNVLLLGDSHAADLRDGLEAALPDVHLMQATASQCKPTLSSGLLAAAECRRLVEHVYHDFLTHNSVDLLIVTGRWTESDLPRVAETLDWLKQRGVPVLLIGPTAQYRGAVPQLVALGREARDPNFPTRRLRPDVPLLDRRMRRLAQAHDVRFASSYRVFCPNRCIQLDGEGVPLQHDYGHLTREGSIYLITRLNNVGAFELPAG